MNARALLEDLRSRDVRLYAHRNQLTVNAPDGIVTEEIRGALEEAEPKLLKLLEWERRKFEEAGCRGLIIRWSEYPDWIRLHDPLTGEHHEVRADECLPGVVETANRHWKRKATT